MNEPIIPKLQPPGAGLPWYERLIAKYVIVPRVIRRMTWESASELFQHEGRKIIALWQSLPDEQRLQKVLIPRLRGLEDSSRYWSVALTVEHLNIVGSGIGRLIAGLRAGKVPERTASTADVKPQGKQAPAEVLANFQQLFRDANDNDSPVPRGTGLKTPHPWFGPFDAFQWHCMKAIHQRLHREQIEAIISQLPKSIANK